MANLSYIDTEKSIVSGRLFLNRSRIDKFEELIDTIGWSVLCLGLIFYPALAYFHVDISSPNDRAVAFVLFPLIILCGIYGLYRKLTEKKLICIDTLSPMHKNKEYLLEFLKLNGYEVFRENNKVVIVNVEESHSFNNLWTKTITFILKDRRIYFAMVKNYPHINPPVFFSHWSLKTELKKYFRNK
jgi:hypothetical protein